MKSAFYKNWKKIALVLTSIFWASCSDDSSSGDVLYGCPSDVCDPQEPNSSSSDDLLSSFEEQTSTDSNSVETSSTSIEQNQEINSSSDNVEPKSSNSNGTKIACSDTTLYKYENKFPCLDGICPEYGVSEIPYNQIKCKDNTKYELEVICPENELNEIQPEYGVIDACINNYIGKNNTKYSEEEFKKIYEIKTDAPESSSSEEKIIEPNSSSDFNQISPKYGVMIDKIDK